MWPWEHVAVGYLLYSAYVRVRHDNSPDTWPALAVGFGALFPDLVDKPLAWTVDVLPSGVSVAHSVFTALVLATCVVWVLDHVGHRQIGVGFAVAYLAHLPADALYPVLLGDRVHLRAFLWPVATTPDAGGSGFLAHVVEYGVAFVHFLGTPRGLAFLVLEVTLVGSAIAVWIADGHPGLTPWRSWRSDDPATSRGD